MSDDFIDEIDMSNFKMPIAWMKPGAPSQHPLRSAILGMTWLICLVCSKFMQFGKFDIWTILITQFALAGFIFCAVCWEDIKPVWTSIVGKPAPSLSGVEYVQGGPISFSSGKVTVVNFWHTSEEACLKALPRLDELARQWQKDGTAQVLALSVEHRVVLEPWLKARSDSDKLHCAVACDYNMFTTKGYPVTTVPYAFVIGRDGKVTWQGHPLRGLESAVNKAVNKKLKNA